MSGQADFRTFYLALSATDREAFAAEAGSTVKNIAAHWVSARRVPKSRADMEQLYKACVKFGAAFSKEQLLAFFYGEELRAQ
jgi:hypothetical protein